MEPIRYDKTFDDSGYHTALLTTYAFSAQSFEDVLLHRLRNAGCRNIHILADEFALNTGFVEFGTPRFAGRLYNLQKVRPPQRGAFHPKIALQLGAKKLRLLVGSANLTGSGLAGNLEIVNVLECHEAADPALPLIRHALDYVRGWAEGDPWTVKAIDEALRNTSLLRDLDPAPAVDLGDGTGPLEFISDRPDASPLQAMVAHLGKDEIRRLIVISPYWDARLGGLERLASAAGWPRVDIVLDGEDPGFPANALSRPAFNGRDIRFFDRTFGKRSRFMHAKLFIALGRDADHVISGSMNCSLPALSGISRDSGNAEAGFYRRMPAGAALPMLGLDGSLHSTLSRAAIADAGYQSHLSAPDEASRPDGGRLRVVGGAIIWTRSGAEGPPERVGLFDIDGSPIAVVEHFVPRRPGVWRLRLSIAAESCVSGVVTLADGRRSAPVIVEHVKRLKTHTQPKATGAVAKGLDVLRFLPDEGLEFLEVLQLLEQDAARSRNSEVQTKASRPGHSGERNRTDDAEVPEDADRTLSYAEFTKRHRDEAGAQDAGAYSHVTLAEGRPIGEVSAALNRILGLMSRDHDADDDAVLMAGEEDLSPREPGHDAEVLDDEPGASGSPAASASPAGAGTPRDDAAPQRRRRNSQMKGQLLDAVEGLEARLKTLGYQADPAAGDSLHDEEKVRERDEALAAPPVSLSDVVRLRAVLQILCACSTPLGAKPSALRPLPVSSKDKKGWPRLFGRVIFAALRVGDSPFGQLRMEDDIARTPDEIIHAWGACLWCIRAARDAARRDPQIRSLEKLLGSQEAALLAVLDRDLCAGSPDYGRVIEFVGVLGSRFNTALGVEVGTG